MVEGLTFLINSSNFADDIVLYCVCGRAGRVVTKKMEDGRRAWSRALALELTGGLLGQI